MKNFLNYFYNINIQDIVKAKNKYKFTYNNNYYVLEHIYLNEEVVTNIYNFNIEILSNGIICNKIILNNQNKPLTIYDNKAWVLMETVDNFEKRITFQDIFSFPIKTNNDNFYKNNNWKQLWSMKNDYLEYQINQLGLNYPLLRESFSYFNGLSENAIQLLNNVTNDDLYVVHKRVNYHMTYYDLYNPFNMVLDTKVRDMAEYFKDAFLLKKDIDKELDIFLENYYLTDNEKLLFIIRMLYPTFYFDMFENITDELKEEKKIKKIIASISDYEKLLNTILDKIGLINIEWLKKDTTSL